MSDSPTLNVWVMRDSEMLTERKVGIDLFKAYGNPEVGFCALWRRAAVSKLCGGRVEGKGTSPNALCTLSQEHLHLSTTNSHD